MLDLMLPGMTGFDIVRHLARVRPELLRRIIVITAVSQSQLQRFEHEWTIWRLIRKPFDVAEFVQTVRECVRAHAPDRFEKIDALTRWLAVRASACGARSSIVVTSSGQELLLAASFGFADGVVEGYFPLPMSVNYPLSVAVRTGNAVWLASLTPPLAEYPLLLPLWTMNAAQSLAAVPLLDGERRLGGIGWTFREPQQFDGEQRTMLMTMASECGRCSRVDEAAGRSRRATHPAAIDARCTHPCDSRGPLISSTRIRTGAASRTSTPCRRGARR